MAVYVDELQKAGAYQNPNWHSSHYCHLMGDSLHELHMFASIIGMKRGWFQNHKRYPHYDLTPTKRILAVSHGAIEMSSIELIRYFKEKHEEKNTTSA